MVWNESTHPYKELQNTITAIAGLRQNELLDLFKEGSDKLFKNSCKERLEKNEEDKRLDKYKEFYKFHEYLDPKKSYYYLRKFALANFCSDTEKSQEMRNRFIAHCEMLRIRFPLDEKNTASHNTGALSVNKSIQEQLDYFIEEIQKLRFVTLPAVVAASNKENELMKLEIVSLREIMHSYLDELTIDPGEDVWDELEDDQYNRLIALNSKTYFRFHGEHSPVVLLVFEAPLEQQYYVIWIEVFDDFIHIETYSNLNGALQHLIDFLNDNPEYTLYPPSTEFEVEYLIDGQFKKRVTYNNETSATLAAKFMQFIQ